MPNGRRCLQHRQLRLLDFGRSCSEGYARAAEPRLQSQFGLSADQFLELGNLLDESLLAGRMAADFEEALLPSAVRLLRELQVGERLRALRLARGGDDALGAAMLALESSPAADRKVAGADLPCGSSVASRTAQA